MLDLDADHPPDSSSLRGVVPLLSSKGLGSVFLSGLGITRNGDALTALRCLLFLRRSEGHLCAVSWDACQSWESRKHFLKMPKRGCMAPCLNGRPHGPHKHFNFGSKALCGMLEGFTCVYRGCSLYPYARDYRLFPRKTPSWKVVLRENQLSGWARDLNFSTSGRMLTLATLVRLKQNMTPQDVIFARESCHLTIWFLAKLSAALSNTLYFLTNSTFTFILGFFLPFFFLMNSLESIFQPTKKHLNDWISKVWVLLQTTVTGRKINGFLLMTHISPLWWSKAMDYIYFFSFPPHFFHMPVMGLLFWLLVLLLKMSLSLFALLPIESLKLNAGKVEYTCHLDQLEQRLIENTFLVWRGFPADFVYQKMASFVPNGLKFK